MTMPGIREAEVHWPHICNPDLLNLSQTLLTSNFLFVLFSVEIVYAPWLINAVH